MKNFLIFVVLFLLFSAKINAQITFKTNLGFKAGLQQSDVVGTEKDGTATGFIGTEFYAGFFADTQVGKNTTLENELLFSMTDSYFFLEIPIHLKHKVFNKFFVLYGTKVDFPTTNNNPGYKFESLGISAEIGAQFMLNKKMFVELRYNRGFTKQINDLQLEILEARRNTLRLGIGVKF